MGLTLPHRVSCSPAAQMQRWQSDHTLFEASEVAFNLTSSLNLSPPAKLVTPTLRQYKDLT